MKKGILLKLGSFFCGSMNMTPEIQGNYSWYSLRRGEEIVPMKLWRFKKKSKYDKTYILNRM